MKFTISGEHLRVFQRHRAIEFEEILQEDELQLIREPRDGRHGTLETRDFWRKSKDLAKVVCHRRIGELVNQLTEERPVRMGYDLYIPEGLPKRSKQTCLKDFSSVQGILCGALFPLEDSPSEIIIEEMPPLSLKAGNALFVDPEFPIPWDLLTLGGEVPYYVVVYTAGKSVYIHNENDPYSRFLFGQGYGFGDRLKEETNPLIYR